MPWALGSLVVSNHFSVTQEKARQLGGEHPRGRGSDSGFLLLVGTPHFEWHRPLRAFVYVSPLFTTTTSCLGHRAPAWLMLSYCDLALPSPHWNLLFFPTGLSMPSIKLVFLWLSTVFPHPQYNGKTIHDVLVGSE